MICDYVARHLPAIKVVQSQGTYLLWLDCRGLGMSDTKLREFFVQEARGTVFGRNGSGFMRLNIASPRQVIAEALEQIKRAMDLPPDAA